jgi:pyrroline-5-carboxylate reductase
MGSALFAGWAARGLPPSVLIDPMAPPSVPRPQDTLVRSVAEIPAGFIPGAVVLAIKPQMAGTVLPSLGTVLPPEVLVISILAGPSASRISQLLGTRNPIIRAMPNTPAAIGQGMTVAFAGPGVSPAQHAVADALLSASGALAWLNDEALIDPVTSVSGSGPAYVFLLAELMEQAGIAQGLPPDLARLLARKTVSGAGALLDASPEDSAQLRRNVTSPNGVTERALAVLMESWPEAVERALRAATERSREMGSVLF